MQRHEENSHGGDDAERGKQTNERRRRRRTDGRWLLRQQAGAEGDRHRVIIGRGVVHAGGKVKSGHPAPSLRAAEPASRTRGRIRRFAAPCIRPKPLRTLGRLSPRAARTVSRKSPGNESRQVRVQRRVRRGFRFRRIEHPRNHPWRGGEASVRLRKAHLVEARGRIP